MRNFSLGNRPLAGCPDPRKALTRPATEQLIQEAGGVRGRGEGLAVQRLKERLQRGFFIR
jgi:hypothetical protein